MGQSDKLQPGLNSHHPLLLISHTDDAGDLQYKHNNKSLAILVLHSVH